MKSWPVHSFLLPVFVSMLSVAFSGRLSGQSMYAGAKGGISVPSLHGGNSEISEGYSTRMGPDFGVFAGGGGKRTECS